MSAECEINWCLVFVSCCYLIKQQQLTNTRHHLISHGDDFFGFPPLTHLEYLIVLLARMCLDLLNNTKHTGSK